MGTKIKCSLFIILCVCVLLSACANHKPSTPPSVQPNNPVSEETKSQLPDEYDAIIRNIIRAYPWNDDDRTIVPENPELSYMYRRVASLSDVGFALIDLDQNGQTELIISGIDMPFIFDLYTISDGEVIHLFSSAERNSYYLFENGYMENQWSSASDQSGHDFYTFSGAALHFQERITFDGRYAIRIGLTEKAPGFDPELCYFRSESDQFEDYQSVTSDEAINAIQTNQTRNEPLEITYTLLSEYIS